MYFNLKNQSFDFFQNFGSMFHMKDFLYTLTFYPTSFRFQEGSMCMDYKYIFSPEAPNDVHVMIRENGAIDLEFNIGIEFQKVFDEILHQSANHLTTPHYVKPFQNELLEIAG